MTGTGEVRFAPMNGHRQFEPSGPKSAKNGLMHRSEALQKAIEALQHARIVIIDGYGAHGKQPFFDLWVQTALVAHFTNSISLILHSFVKKDSRGL
jgi:hypothetical protein